MSSAITDVPESEKQISGLPRKLFEELGKETPSGDGKLHAAVRMASRDPEAHRLIQFLLEEGADPNEIYQNRTPVHVAVECFNSKALESILAAGGNVNKPGPHGRTPKMIAIKWGLFDLPSDRMEEIANILSILSRHGATL